MNASQGREREERDYKSWPMCRGAAASVPTAFDTHATSPWSDCRTSASLCQGGRQAPFRFSRLRSCSWTTGWSGSSRPGPGGHRREDVSGTVHTEYGLRFQVDPRKAYFTPVSRTSAQIASRCGRARRWWTCSPGRSLAIMIAKLHSGVVYAGDLNPRRVQLMRRTWS